MRTRMVLALGAVLATAVGFAAATVAAQTTASRVTQGEATAVFQGVERRAPDPLRVKIMPFAGSLFDGRHYCSLDWHAIMATFLDGPSESEPNVTRQDVKAGFQATTVAFTLDGSLLVTGRTAMKEYLDPGRAGFIDAWFVNFGRVLSPESLSPGPHTLDVTIDDPASPPFPDGITFFMDAPGTGACLS